MYKQDLVLNNQKRLIHHKTEPKQLCFVSKFQVFYKCGIYKQIESWNKVHGSNGVYIIG